MRWYLVGSVVFVLGGCGGGWLAQQREPWRHEAEVACLKSGAVKVSPVVAQLPAIEGPGMCGADFPLKVAALGESALLSFADELRPPGAIPGRAARASPAASSGYQQAYPQQAYPQPAYPAPYAQRPATPPAYGAYPAAPGAPMSLEPPGDDPDDEEPDQYRSPAAPNRPAHGRPGALTSQPLPAPGAPYRSGPYSEGPYGSPQTQPLEPYFTPAPRTYGGSPSQPQGRPDPLPRLGPVTPSLAAGPATVTPAATLACPMVSQLDQWITGSVQPAAMRWFGQPVAEIRQISAYSCRGMNGNSRARISEHAFGNALDISAFTLADGRKVTVKDGWKGLPEERGFLRDVHAGACEQFNTVLGPGSNIYHYDHLHFDLMRRSSGNRICNPAAVPGDLVAGRMGQPAQSAEVTGSLNKQRIRRTAPLGYAASRDPLLPGAVAGED